MSIRYCAVPGVVAASICDTYMLVSTRSARQQVPYVLQINETSAFLWKCLSADSYSNDDSENAESGATFDRLLQAVLQEYDVEDPDEAKEAITQFLEQMIELNYVKEID